MTKLTARDLEAIRTLSEAATPGPWVVYNGNSWWRIGTDEAFGGDDCAVLYPTKDQHDGHPNLSCARGGDLVANLEFIARARTAIPELLAHADALEAKNEEYDALFELQWKRTKDASRLWQKATGNHDSMPDLGMLIEWLLERAEKAEARVAELEAELREGWRDSDRTFEA